MSGTPSITAEQFDRYFPNATPAVRAAAIGLPDPAKRPAQLSMIAAGSLVAPSKNEAHDHPARVQNAKPERHKTPALERADAGKEESLPSTRVRFVGYRVRPLDPDNFAGSVKDLLDGLRHAQLIPGDEPWRITLETEQVKVGSFKEEKTVIEIETV